MTDLPTLTQRLRDLAEVVEAVEWQVPLTSHQTCLDAASLLEKLNSRLDKEVAEAEAFQLDVRSALGCPDDGVPFTEHIRKLRETLAAIKRDIPKLHRRKCCPCQVVHYHSDDHGTPVDCPDCGSRDTRRILE